MGGQGSPDAVGLTDRQRLTITHGADDVALNCRVVVLCGSETNALIKRHDAGGKQNDGNAIGQRKRDPDTR